MIALLKSSRRKILDILIYLFIWKFEIGIHTVRENILIFLYCTFDLFLVLKLAYDKKNEVWQFCGAVFDEVQFQHKMSSKCTQIVFENRFRQYLSRPR